MMEKPVVQMSDVDSMFGDGSLDSDLFGMALERLGSALDDTASINEYQTHELGAQGSVAVTLVQGVGLGWAPNKSSFESSPQSGAGVNSDNNNDNDTNGNSNNTTRVYVRARVLGCGKSVRSSIVRCRTGDNRVWGDEWVFPLPWRHAQLRLTVFQAFHVGRDRFLGQVTLPLTPGSPNKQQQQQLSPPTETAPEDEEASRLGGSLRTVAPLSDPRSKAAPTDIISGSLEVRLKFIEPALEPDQSDILRVSTGPPLPFATTFPGVG